MKQLMIICSLLSFIWSQESLGTAQTPISSSIGMEVGKDSTGSADSIETIGMNSGRDGHEQALAAENATEILMAVVPLQFHAGDSEYERALDSLMLASLDKHPHTVVNSGIHTEQWNWQDEQLCLTDNCLEHYASKFGLTHILVWNLFDSMTVNLELYELETPNAVLHRQIPLTGDPLLSQLSLDEAVQSLLQEVQTSDHASVSQLNPLMERLSSIPIRYYAGGAGAVILTWALLQSRGSETPSQGIGDPPDWPQP